jgi:hypothetical protein
MKPANITCSGIVYDYQYVLLLVNNNNIAMMRAEEEGER